MDLRAFGRLAAGPLSRSSSSWFSVGSSQGPSVYARPYFTLGSKEMQQSTDSDRSSDCRCLRTCAWSARTELAC